MKMPLKFDVPFTFGIHSNSTMHSWDTKRAEQGRIEKCGFLIPKPDHVSLVLTPCVQLPLNSLSSPSHAPDRQIAR